MPWAWVSVALVWSSGCGSFDLLLKGNEPGFEEKARCDAGLSVYCTCPPKDEPDLDCDADGVFDNLAATCMEEQLFVIADCYDSLVDSEGYVECDQVDLQCGPFFVVEESETTTL
ncbi:MAG: hypothetical protein AAGA48_07485 [Myxococcota bacterium]